MNATTTDMEDPDPTNVVDMDLDPTNDITTAVVTTIDPDPTKIDTTVTTTVAIVIRPKAIHILVRTKKFNVAMDTDPNP